MPMITWYCPHCDYEIEVSVSPTIPERISGPPEDCYPAEGGEIEGIEEGDRCPGCGCEIEGGDLDRLVERSNDLLRDHE